MNSEAAGATSAAGKLWYLVIAAVVLALDQLTKYWAAVRLSEGEDIHVIPGFLRFSYTENAGIAFGMLGDSEVRWALVGVSTVAIVVVIVYLLKTSPGNRLLLWSLAMLAAGIGGNLVDRVRTGRVIDFIEFYFRAWQFPVFNVADTAITVGAALMAIDLFVNSAREPATASAPVAGDAGGVAGEGLSKDLTTDA